MLVCSFIITEQHLGQTAERHGRRASCVPHLLLLPSQLEAIHPSKGEEAAQGQEGSPH